MIASTLHLSLLLVRGQWADDVDATGREAVELGVLDLGLGHQTSRGADNVVAFAVPTADILGENDLFAEAAGFLTDGAHWDDLETHDAKLHQLLVGHSGNACNATECSGELQSMPSPVRER